MLFQTENIKLRKVEATDLSFLYLWENDTEAWTAGDTHNPLSHSDLQEYIACTTGDIYKDRQLRLIIQKGDHSVGCIDIFDFDVHNKKAAIGIYVEATERGKGVGQCAVKLVVDYLKDFMHLNMVYAFVQEDNTASNKLFEKVGFRNTALLLNWHNGKNVYVWQLL